MLRAARVVRVIDDAGDAGINAAKCRDEVADVHIVRAIVERKELMRGAHVVAKRGGIRNDAAKLAFPGRSVAGGEAREDDGIRRLDHLNLTWHLDPWSYGNDLLPLNQ